MSLRRLSFVLGLVTLAASAASSIGCATSGDGGAGGGGDDGGAAGDDGGALGDGGQPRNDSGNPQGDSGNAGDSGNPGDSGGTCVKPPPASCGLAPQCGCGANQTCEVTDLTGATACTGAGSAPQGHACTTTGGCAAGLTCVFGACRPYCATAGTACGMPLGDCLQVKNTSMVDIVNLKVCLVACALDDANSCGGLPTNTTDPVATCVPTTTGVTDCETGGRSTTTCGGQNAPFCAPGYLCANGTTCQKWCKVGGTGQCGALTCGALMPAVSIGGIQYGSCR